jgi:ribonucleoside-diphosphate reductase alpha chain
VTYEPTGLALEIFRKRYAISTTESFPEACARVASHVAQAEEGEARESYREAFREELSSNRFMPGGRIWYGSGRPKGQLLNCFVVPTSDSREGWGKTVSDMIIICGTGGGLGVNGSPVRPRGMPITGSGGTATGSVSLFEIINAAGEVIKAGGGRRTALMLSLGLNHGDIIEFLDTKLDLNRLNNANVSVIFDQDPKDFFAQIRANETLPLEFRGRTAGSVQAKELWDKIIANALKSGEPGLLNGYYANQMSNIGYHAPLINTNPCVTGDTKVLTDAGYRRIDSLVGERVNVWNGFEWSQVTPAVTGHNRETLRVTLSSGRELVTTENHAFWLATNYQGGTKRVEAKDLRVGDKLIKHEYPVIEHGTSVPYAYSQGFISGDGMDNYSYAYVYAPKYVCMSRLSGSARGESSGKTRFDWDFDPHSKAFVPFGWNLKSRLDWFAGLLDSDGTELREGGTQVASVNRAFLLDVQLMLTTVGVASKIKPAQEARLRMMPDGRGGEKEYPCQDLFRLLVGAVQIQELKRLGMRCERLAFNKTPQRDASQFVTVESVEPAGVAETVYCFTEPKRNLGCFNGVVTGQCGEIWLTAYDCCCLGALVLPRFVKGGEIDWPTLDRSVDLAVRFLDNVLSTNRYPLPEIEQTCSDIRRIGLGVMGLHDMLLMLGLRYNSPEGLELVDRVMKRIKNAAYHASIDLAKEKGPFPKFNLEKYLQGGFAKTLRPRIRRRIEEHGIRNCAILTIAPTGTTSMVCGVSSGIEPLFAPAYLRRYRDGERLAEETVVHPLFARFVEEGRDTSHFQGAHELSIRDHLEMQRTCQKHVDNAVSKTINVAPGTSPEELSAAYMEYFPELKGVTIYPEGARENQPLTPLTLEQALGAAGTALVGTSGVDACKSGQCDV